MSCDIIIPVWNKKDITEKSIKSIIQNTYHSYKLIIIDNGSEEFTENYLQSLKNNKGLQLDLIRNEKNLGFTKAVNQGIKKSKGEYVCVLNNDALPMDGWLTEMINVAESSSEIGLVNPRSNTLGHKPVKNELLKDYVERLKNDNKGQWVEIGSAIGFCMLIKRAVIDKIGYLNEIYSPGYFDDTEYSLRAKRAGYKSVVAKGAYVYHKEHSTFKAKNLEKYFGRNQEIFYKEFSKPRRILYVLTKENKEYFKKLKEEIYNLAQERNWIKIFIKGSLSQLDLVKHGHIKVILISPIFFKIHSIFNILVKKKKFTQIYVDDKKLFNILNNLRRSHKANIEMIKSL
ncbi:MAG: hypothetical protein DRP84_08800 [Spirochaetes bacterium]|nr:MAG: hypothetical protein DRP84_08800 [Spirochaetota bacterium]